MKKIIPVFLALVLILSACTSAPSEPEQQEPVVVEPETYKVSFDGDLDNVILPEKTEYKPAETVFFRLPHNDMDYEYYAEVSISRDFLEDYDYCSFMMPARDISITIRELPHVEPEPEITENEPIVEEVPETPMPEDTDFVRVLDYIPNTAVNLRYATEDNFTGSIIYDFNDAYLRYGTVKKLSEVEKELETYGFRLMIWDAFRPAEAQWTLWKMWPDATYVANPNNGFSSHTRGNTVDVTLVASDGAWMRMPSDFDDFSALADRDYSDVDFEDAVNNVMTLENAMVNGGFVPYSGEWWHFSDSDEYEVETEFAPPSMYEPGTLDWFNNVYFKSSFSRHFLNSEYDDVRNVDLLLLFYDGAETSSEVTDEEIKAYLEMNDLGNDMILDFTKFTPTEADNAFLTYTGMKVDDTALVNYDAFTYLDEFEAYYLMHGDTNANNYVMSSLERDGNTVRLSYAGFDEAQYVVTLLDMGDDVYYISSNMKAQD